MKTLLISLSILSLVFLGTDKTVYQFTMTTIDGKDVSISEYKGKVILFVNTASECGYTPQYEGLQKLYEKYNDQGLVILGFPSNDFGGQEPGSDDEIQAFCTKNYGVTFPMFSKITVKGADKHPLYQFLTEKTNNGKVEQEVKWNFFKFLVNRNGEVVQAFPSSVKPLSDDILVAIEKEL
tara:strand:+ start:832 stop:1371 length:540 start_codon:yes stop_codon:yes gene_type:complete